MSIKAIEPDIQEEILEALPSNYKDAIEVMAQLSANMLLSGEGTSIEEFMDLVRAHHTAYMEDEA
jgi:hypothetical protein